MIEFRFEGGPFDGLSLEFEADEQEDPLVLYVDGEFHRYEVADPDTYRWAGVWE